MAAIFKESLALTIFVRRKGRFCNRKRVLIMFQNNVLFTFSVAFLFDFEIRISNGDYRLLSLCLFAD